MSTAFATTLQNRNKSVNIRFQPHFSDKHWPEIQSFAQESIRGGFLDWNLDFCELQFINSMLLGLIIELNAKVMARGGRLSITMKRGSKVAQLLLISKINRIISLYQV